MFVCVFLRLPSANADATVDKGEKRLVVHKLALLAVVSLMSTGSTSLNRAA